MARRQNTLQRNINRLTRVSTNVNGAGRSRLVTKRTKDAGTLSGTRLKEGSQTFGTRAQREYDVRSAFKDERFSDGTLERQGKSYRPG